MFLKQLPFILGILNLTPDSFSDGGDFLNPEKAIQRAEEMMSEGADMIDVGAESSAPNSKEVLAEEEWNRLKIYFQNFRKRKSHFPSIRGKQRL
ncbi:dihydropteroate synthase [Candidatus Peregrinibacteria bacterium]|nr:dihydropteroate synthase [Candidatus Peregrinibacteria bacterium]